MPLMAACRKQSIEIATLLLKHGANANQKNIYGDAAIIFAANLDRSNKVELLINSGAEIKGSTGVSALGVAVESGATKTVRLLIKKGADVNYCPPGQFTPLEMSYVASDDEITLMLQKAGAKGQSKEQVEKYQRDRMAQYQKKLKDNSRTRSAANQTFVNAQDLEIIIAAITHMQAYRGDGIGLPWSNKKKPVILVSETLDDVNEFTENQMNGELDERKANDIDFAMRKDFFTRNTSRSGISIPLPNTNLFKLKPIAEIPRFYSWDREAYMGWVHVYHPGVSSDGKRAFLRFICGPSAHGAAGTYLLVKLDGKWIVRWRYFACYV